MSSTVPRVPARDAPTSAAATAAFTASTSSAPGGSRSYAYLGAGRLASDSATASDTARGATVRAPNATLPPPVRMDMPASDGAGPPISLNATDPPSSSRLMPMASRNAGATPPPPATLALPSNTLAPLPRPPPPPPRPNPSPAGSGVAPGVAYGMLLPPPAAELPLTRGGGRPRLLAGVAPPYPVPAASSTSSPPASGVGSALSAKMLRASSMMALRRAVSCDTAGAAAAWRAARKAAGPTAPR